MNDTTRMSADQFVRFSFGDLYFSVAALREQNEKLNYELGKAQAELLALKKAQGGQSDDQSDVDSEQSENDPPA